MNNCINKNLEKHEVSSNMQFCSCSALSPWNYKKLFCVYLNFSVLVQNFLILRFWRGFGEAASKGEKNDLVILTKKKCIL